MPDSLANDTLQLLPFYQWDTAGTMPVPEVSYGIPLDSLFRPVEPEPVVMRKSMFVNHSLQPSESSHLVERADTTQPAWLFGLLLLLVGAICLYYNSRKLKLGELFASLVSRRTMDRVVRNSNLSRDGLALPMGLLVVAALSISVYVMALMHNGPAMWLLVFAALSVGYMLRNGVLRLIASVFGNQSAVSVYITSNYIFHMVAALVITPLLFLQIYLPGGKEIVFYVIMGVIAVFFIVRLARGIKLFLTHAKGSYFFLFYYLCTVEIIPILVLLKWIIS